MVARDRSPQIEVFQWRRQILAEFGGAIEALRAADAMDRDEVQDWTNRMHVALGLGPLDPLPPGFKGVRTVIIGDDERPTPPPTRPVARFLELIPVRDADRELPYGGRLQLLGIERYDSKLASAWRMAPLPDAEIQYADELREHERDTEGLPEGERRMMRQRFLRELNLRERYKLAPSDDLGTEYRGMGGGTSASDNEQTGRARFMPGIPNAASMLTIRWDELVFQVSISDPEEPK
jgi:hypothetical protein